MKNIEANFRLTPWLMATALSVVLAACGGGDQSPILGAGGIAPVVVLPPTVTVVTPSAGALNVAPNTQTITAAFSKAIDPATLTLSSVLSSATVCTATITTAAKDSTGLNLASDYVWQFTTSASTDVTAPTVTLVNPADAATGVATNTAVKATVSEAMDPFTVNAANFTLTSVGAPVAGTATFGVTTSPADPAKSELFG